MHPSDTWGRAARDAEHLRDRLGTHRAVVVLGSGWSHTADLLGHPVAELATRELAGFPEPTVPGHHGTVRSVDVDGVPVLVLRGRAHLYEGHDAAAVVHGVRAAVLSGCSAVVLTNAAGSLRPEWEVGTPVVLSDHLNLTGTSPLVGPEPPGRPGNRFVDLTDLYDTALREAARRADPGCGEGVYAGLLGGAFETPAEIRALGALGADLVGMSTVLEAVAARHLGARVAGVSLVTNPAAGLGGAIDHAEVLTAAADAAPRLAALVRVVLAAA